MFLVLPSLAWRRADYPQNKSEPLSFPGKKVLFSWDAPGEYTPHGILKIYTDPSLGSAVGPNNSYVTSTAAGTPKWVGWSQQLNLT